MERAKSFGYLGGRLSDGSKAAVTVRMKAKIVQAKFWKCRELLQGRELLLKMKKGLDRVVRGWQCCVGARYNVLGGMRWGFLEDLKKK